MKNSRFLKNAWTSIAFYNYLQIIETENFNSRFFFGKEISDRNITELVGEVEECNRLQAEKLVATLWRTQQERGNGYLEYFSAGQSMVYVAAYTEYVEAGEIYLHVTEIPVSHLYQTDTTGHEGYMSLQQRYESLFNQMSVIFDSLPVGVELYGSDGAMLYLNIMDCKIFGIDRQPFMEHPINIFENPNLPEEVPAAVRDGVTVCTHFPYNFALVAEKDYYKSSQPEAVRWIKCSGRPIRNGSGEYESYVFIVEDVTEAVRMEEMLRQSKQKTELAMQAAEIVLWEFDTRTALFISENEPLNNYNRTEPVPLSEYQKRIHPDDLPKVGEVLEQVFKGDDQLFCFDFRMKLPGNKDWQYFTINGSPFEKDADGKVIKYVGFRKNNTDQVKRKLLQENILNSIPLPILIKDVEENFGFFFCNQESKRMFGTSEDIVAYDILDPEQVRQMQKTDLEVFTTGKPYFGQERIGLKDGRVYDTIVQKSVIYDGEKRLLLSIRWDKSVENELERQAKVLSISMNVLNAYNWFYDPTADVISFGKGFEQAGRDAQRVNSLEKFIRFVHPDDHRILQDALNGMIGRESGDFIVEYRIDLNGNGSYEWWECRGVVETSLRYDLPYKYLFGMSVNIQGHKTTELTLLKNKEELNQLIRQNELVLNNTNSGLAFISKDFIVQWENISVCSASLSYEAYKKGEFCYKSAHNRTSPCENCVLQRSMQSHQVEQIKFQLDTNHVVEIFATPVFDVKNDLEGIVIRLDDVTEREQIITELQRAKLRAEQSDKLKSAFLANMSHEIRTPLNAIVGFSDLLMNSSETEEKAGYMQIINTNNELLLKLISDILDLSKIEAGAVELKYEEFDLSEYFDGIVESMRQRVTNPEVQLIAINPFMFCWVRLDRNRVAQILTNYVTNAIKYTPRGHIEMGYEQVEGGVRLYVKDSGIGISEDKRDRVFHRFEKLDEFAQGTGLGLSICKAIAVSMGGSVGFDSEYGSGSLFWVFLPCEIATGEGGGHNRMSMVSSDKGEVTGEICGQSADKVILVAEDVPSNYLLVSALLSDKFELIHSLNGQEAVKMVMARKVDLVLMDMKMPVMDGLRAVSEIRKFNTEIPVVALTAHAFDTDKEVALEIGCNDYLVKPLDKDKLMAVLRKYLNFS